MHIGINFPWQSQEEQGIKADSMASSATPTRRALCRIGIHHDDFADDRKILRAEGGQLRGGGVDVSACRYFDPVLISSELGKVTFGASCPSTYAHCRELYNSSGRNKQMT